MALIPEIPDDHFDGEANISRSHTSEKNLATLIQATRDAIVINENNIAALSVISDNVRYVDVNNSNPTPDGSLSNPYTSIQDAIDEFESIGGFTRTNSAMIYVESGTYAEALVIHQPGINIMCRAQSSSYTSPYIQVIPPSGEAALTLTNATPASLAAYNASGVYSDLVNQGDAGPNANSFSGFRLAPPWGTAMPVRLLGVKGDDSPDTTDFGNFIQFYECLFVGQVSNVAFYARNAGVVNFVLCDSISAIEFINCYFSQLYYSILEGVKSKYDAADPEGRHRYTGTTFALDRLIDCTMQGAQNNSNVIDNRLFETSGCTLGTRDKVQNTELLNGAIWRSHNTGIRGEVNAAGDIDITAYGSMIDGDFILGSGPGIVDWSGGGWTGDLTDPDNKLARVPEKLYLEPNVRYVDVNSTHLNPDGSPQAPYATVQAAIDEAFREVTAVLS